jgi:hypothetical protein
MIISHGILDELEKHGISSDRIGSLREVAELLGLKHDNLTLNGRSTRCVYGDIQNLYNFVKIIDDNTIMNTNSNDEQKTLKIDNQN